MGGNAVKRTSEDVDQESPKKRRTEFLNPVPDEVSTSDSCGAHNNDSVDQESPKKRNTEILCDSVPEEVSVGDSCEVQNNSSVDQESPKKRNTELCDAVPEEVSAGDSCEAENNRSVSQNDVLNLVTLPDDVLLILLSYLNTTELLQISRCNRRMYNICTAKALWTKVDAVCDGHSPPYICIPLYVHSGTVSMKFRKNTAENEPENSIDTCFGKDFFARMDILTNLKILHITNHNLNREILSLSYLPNSITELRLTGTRMTDSKNFLTKIEEILPNLEFIDVSYCQWFDPQFLVPLAKCRNLKVLLMVGCRNMKDIIPYASIAAAYGYRQLETLDMRLTGVVDREIGCFNKIKSLKHIFLERPEDIEDSDESITDICTTSLGMRNWRGEEIHDTNGNRVIICRIPKDGGNFSDHVLETLVVRNYPRITDITLKHAEKCLRSLKHLDVSGSSCSAEQIAIFRTNRPEQPITSSFSYEYSHSQSCCADEECFCRPTVDSKPKKNFNIRSDA